MAGSDGALSALIHLPQGEHCDLVLEISDRKFTGKPVQPDLAWAATVGAWRKAIPDLDMTIADDDARHSYCAD